jgi:hypothetical protein
MIDTVLAELETNGLLLKTDPKLPNVCALVAGGPVHGSWWSHPLSHQMFRVLTGVASHPDVLTTKLISGKDTFIHRSLWPPFLAVAMGRELWQFDALDAAAHALLKGVEKHGVIETSGVEARALEKALLVHGEQVHTAQGSHGKTLKSWTKWMAGASAGRPELTVAQGRESLDKTVSYLNSRYGGRGKLPWWGRLS